ncbi:hypothetical protein YTPLAS18_40680 [Nitrospira sp.]|nr:hypothetical protein YTPLAS18_40680 [Nitrospira sp.]
MLAALAFPAHAQRDSLPDSTTGTSPLVVTRELLPFRGGVVIHGRNPTRDTVWVDTVSTYACRNIYPRCGDRAVDIIIPPGNEKELLRIRPQMREEGYGWRWGYAWHTSGGGVIRRGRAAPGAPEA